MYANYVFLLRCVYGIMKNLLLIPFMLFSFLASAGIYRHDVPLKKYTDLANEPQFDCVGQVYIQEDTLRFSASCVLIADQYVLSARHVFGRDEEIDISKYRFAFKGVYYTSNEYVIFKHGDVTYDIILLKLELPVTHIRPAVINTDTTEFNTTATGVGYGSVRNALMTSGREHLDYKMGGNNVIDSLGGEDYNGHATLLMADFDCPDSEKLNVCGSTLALPLEYVTNGGDSGGGLFSRIGSEYKLIGITQGMSGRLSTTTGSYGSVAKWTRLSIFNDWIMSVQQRMK